MSHPFEHRRPTGLEDKAHAEAVRYFAGHLKQFPASRDAVDQLERDVAKIALAANLAAAKPTASVIHAGDGSQWQKGVDLMENVCLCHRPVNGGAEFAVMEHFPKQGTHEIWNRGGNAVEVLQVFTQEQRQALQFWAEDMTAQVREFLAEKFPGHDLTRVADALVRRLTTHSPSHRQTHSPGENHGRGMRI